MQTYTRIHVSTNLSVFQDNKSGDQISFHPGLSTILSNQTRNAPCY
ncbi:hypothetical protein FGIG_01103 [Fasciola gigantica]|uniref:Uncharacterized protein n=1 Tax=Fasciola gigantica TaxID=46835 RepID=A0A504YEV6_FASGI|nr:hypothetical protein FGIG_01103 [Fasciola gigantica]